jgi:iron complex transport system permease protein
MTRKRLLYIFAFAVMTLVAIVFSVINGTLAFSIGDIIAVLFGRCDNALAQQIITNVRLPRTMIALLVGVNMGVAGALLQSLLRNPLASPNIIGVNSGAGLAAVAIITLLLSSINLVPPAAFVGVMLSSLIIYMLSRRGGSSSVTTIVLAGVALSALLSSVTSAIMILFSDDLTITYPRMIGGLTRARLVLLPADMAVQSGWCNRCGAAQPAGQSVDAGR